MDEKDDFEKCIEIIPESGCWIWTEYISPDGYGRYRSKICSSRLAHRCAYEIYKGKIKDGLEINHICRVRCCVNPDHLEQVTRQENVDKSIPGSSKKTHCHNGHPLSGDNLYLYRGTRACKICRRAASNRRGKRLTDERKVINMRIGKMRLG